MARYVLAAQQLGLAVGNVRVTARGAIRAMDLDADVPPETIAALRELASAVRALAPSLDDPTRADRAREHALAAAGQATLGLDRTQNMASSAIVGQVRSTATDLLRVLGAGRRRRCARGRRTGRAGRAPGAVAATRAVLRDCGARPCSHGPAPAPRIIRPDLTDAARSRTNRPRKARDPHV